MYATVHVLSGMVDHLMRVFTSKAVIGKQRVSVEGGPSFNVFFNLSQRRCGPRLHVPKLDGALDRDCVATWRGFVQKRFQAADSSKGTILVTEAVVNLRWVTDRVSVKVNVNTFPYDSEELGSCQVLEYTLQKRGPMLC